MKHILIGYLGNSDQPAMPVVTEKEKVTFVSLGNANGDIGLGIGQALKDMANLGLTSKHIGIDLLILAALVQAADTRISRATESQNNWTREIKIVVPVHDVNHWQNTENHLEQMLSFLTGDRWEVAFRTLARAVEIPDATRSELEIPITFDQTCLFSGGLDSLIGAIDLLEQGSRPLFVSHAADGSTSSAQEKCIAEIKNHYSGKCIERLRLWMRMPGGLVSGVRSENTTRGRSFLFIAAGVFAGTCISSQPKILVPENGFISLNVPLDPLRIGALSTRTTHPYYLRLWNELLCMIGIQGTIENPYWNRTKGEMLQECQNQSLISTIGPLSSSCSSPTKGRYRGHHMGHCGYCLPCIIRRSAFKRAFACDSTEYTKADLEENILNSLTSEGQQVRSFQMAIKRIADKPDLAKILVLKPGPLAIDSSRFDEFAGVYRRGLEEVGHFLSQVVTAPL